MQYMKQQAAKAKKQTPPKAKKQPAPRRPREQTALTSGGCVNFLDPSCVTPVPTLISAGKALAHTALDSQVLTIPPTRYGLIVATQYAGSSTIGFHCLLDANGAVLANSASTYDLPTLSYNGEFGGPTASRAMKLSVSVVNTTKVVDRGGSVSILNSSQRLPAVSDNQMVALRDAVLASPYRKVVPSETLLGTHAGPNKMISFPVDNTRYHEFAEHGGGDSLVTFLQHCCASVVSGSVTFPPLERAMSIQVWLFDPPTEINTFRITMRAAYYTRWPLTSVPGHHMSQMPTTDANTYNRVVDSAEENAHVLTAAAEGGLIATAGPQIARGIQTLGQTAVTAARGFLGGGAVTAAEEGLMLML